MFGARLGKGRPAAGADGRMLAEDGELSSWAVDWISAACLGRRNSKGSIPWGRSQAEEEAAGMQSGFRKQLSGVLRASSQPSVQMPGTSRHQERP